MDSFSSFVVGVLPLVLLQAAVVWAVLWWVAWERRAAVRAGVFAAVWVPVQLGLLVLLEWLRRGVPGEWAVNPQLLVLVVLPLPAVFLLAWRGMHAGVGRAHEALGCLVPALLAALYANDYELGVMLVSLMACVLSFFLPVVVANSSLHTVSAAGGVRVALAQSMEYWGILICCVMVRDSVPSLRDAMTYGVVFGVPSVLACGVAYWWLRCTVRGALVMGVATGLLLPVAWIVCSMLLPY